MNDLGYEMPQVWDVPSYSRYYVNEDRRKRSEKSTVTGSTTVKPSTTSFQSPTSTQQSVQAQVKRRWVKLNWIVGTKGRVVNKEESRKLYVWFIAGVGLELLGSDVANAVYETIVHRAAFIAWRLRETQSGLRCVRVNSPVEQAASGRQGESTR